VYTAFVTDLFSRNIVGWQVADHLRAGLALNALEMAIFARKDQIDDRLVHHSDPGRSQYTSIRYTQRLEDVGAVRPVGSKGDSYDNAAAEAVNSLYKKELINREGQWQDAGDVTVGQRNGCPGTTTRDSIPPARISPQQNTRKTD
jgi:putative transposase